MSTKIAVDHATPQITEAKQTPEEMVSTGNDMVAKINTSGGVSKAPEVAANLTAWQASITALAANNKDKADAKEKLRQAETAEPGLIRRYRVRKRLLLGAIQAAGDGTAQGVQSFNVEVETRESTPLAGVPQNLRQMVTKKPTYASVRWDVEPGASTYTLQHCTNPQDPSTFSPQISLTKARFHLSGQTPGTTVYFRVLAVDPRVTPTGQTPFTPWLAVLVPG